MIPIKNSQKGELRIASGNKAASKESFPFPSVNFYFPYFAV
jgi:hypothetical protein